MHAITLSLWSVIDRGSLTRWPERYLLGDASKVDARLEPLENVGGASRAPAGYPLNEWCQLSPAEQRRTYDEQHRQDAADQILWEARAHEAWEASEHGAASCRLDVLYQGMSIFEGTTVGLRQLKCLFQKAKCPFKPVSTGGLGKASS